MKIMSVVGARPNFMKVAPIIRAIQAHNDKASGIQSAAPSETPIEHVLVHTGQHYDKIMSDSFFHDLNLPKPDIYLGVGSGTHAIQTAEIMRQFEGVVLREKPDYLIVVGDVNSTVAAALVTSKISFDASDSRPCIVHVEAGLRSFDRTMPEEINRIVTDQLSDLLFVTEKSGCCNLQREGVSEDKVHFVGNTMIDSLLAYQEKADASTILDDLNLRGAIHSNGAAEVMQYALLTLHRPANVDHADAFGKILGGLQEWAQEFPIIFPVHPRTRSRISSLGLERYFAGNQSSVAPRTLSAVSPGIHMIDPLGYLDFVCLMKNASMLVTDSGGIQEESTCLGVPCITVRKNTERPITVEQGTNILAGVETDGIRDAIRRHRTRRLTPEFPEKWDGKAACRIIDILLAVHRDRQPHADLVRA